MDGRVRWAKLFIYLAVVLAILVPAVPRLELWWGLVRGPAGWMPSLPNPWIWSVAAAVAALELGALFLDVGLGLRKVPAWLSGATLGALGLVLVGAGLETLSTPEGWTRLSDAPPGVQAAAGMARLEASLGLFHREHGRFPLEASALDGALAERDGAPIRSAYVYGGLTRRPIAVVAYPGAEGPILEVPEGVLPGSLLYAVDPDARIWWLTAVVGRGVPARPELLQGESGTPLVVSNAPRRP